MIEDEYLGLWDKQEAKGYKQDDPYAYWIGEQFYDHMFIQKAIALRNKKDLES